MNKIAVVAKSEFLRRVKTKSFLLTTFLIPIGIVAFFVVVGAISVFVVKGDGQTVAVVDETGALAEAIVAESGEQTTFVVPDVPVDSVRAAVEAGRYDGYLLLPAELLAGEGEATYYSVEGSGLALGTRLNTIVDRAVEARRLAAENVPPAVLDILRSNPDVRLVKLTEEGEATDSIGASTALGFGIGFIIYMAMFIYGSVVMGGVLEEKQSRVVEVMVSSVRPFDLLMGKVLGIGAMGLVQLGLWAVLILAGTTFAGTAVSLFVDPADFGLAADASQQAVLEATGVSVPTVPVGLVVWFLLFFLGGYLFYASLFAAVGASVEQQQDAQALLLPITLPIILSFALMMPLMESPNGPLAVALSLVPFCSPILMLARMAIVDVPFWQTALSFGLLIGGFVGAVWVSARIYRVGILMYGKKASFKDLARWIRYA